MRLNSRVLSRKRKDEEKILYMAYVTTILLPIVMLLRAITEKKTFTINSRKYELVQYK